MIPRNTLTPAMPIHSLTYNTSQITHLMRGRRKPPPPPAPKAKAVTVKAPVARIAVSKVATAIARPVKAQRVSGLGYAAVAAADGTMVSDPLSGLGHLGFTSADQGALGSWLSKAFKSVTGTKLSEAAGSIVGTVAGVVAGPAAGAAAGSIANAIFNPGGGATVTAPGVVPQGAPAGVTFLQQPASGSPSITDLLALKLLSSDNQPAPPPATAAAQSNDKDKLPAWAIPAAILGVGVLMMAGRK